MCEWQVPAQSRVTVSSSTKMLVTRLSNVLNVNKVPKACAKAARVTFGESELWSILLGRTMLFALAIVRIVPDTTAMEPQEQQDPNEALFSAEWPITYSSSDQFFDNLAKAFEVEDFPVGALKLYGDWQVSYRQREGRKPTELEVYRAIRADVRSGRLNLRENFNFLL